MNGQTINASLTTNTPFHTDKIEWTFVSWFNKTSNAVTNKTCRFVGITVAVLASVFTIIPSLAADLGYAVKRLYDRKINTPQTPIQNFMPSDGSKFPTVPDQVGRRNPDYPYFNEPFIGYVRPNSPDDTYYSVSSQSTTLSGGSDNAFKSAVE